MRGRWRAREKEIETMQEDPRSSVVSLVLLLGVTFSTLSGPTDVFLAEIDLETEDTRLGHSIE